MHYIWAHFIGDYFFQTDWMADNKKKSGSACLVHVLTYMLPFLFMGTWVSFINGQILGELMFCNTAWWKLVLIALQHYVQDRTGFVKWLMEVKGSAKFAEPPMAPWSIILTDNLVHLMWIAFVMGL
jgi:hypothetical protein